jgi:hypothetical protein
MWKANWIRLDCPIDSYWVVEGEWAILMNDFEYNPYHVLVVLVLFEKLGLLDDLNSRLDENWNRREEQHRVIELGILID